MSIKLAILGILSWKPATGYDMKKIIEESTFMHWSGNNNQIYKSLVQLLDDGFVTSEVLHRESAPSKKIYTITEAGLAELKHWVNSAPDLPEYKKSFLTQLAWADQLSPTELDELLASYENEISMHVLLLQEKKRRGIPAPDRTARERYLWEMIHENILTSYKHEWQWVQTVRQELGAKNLTEEENRVNYRVNERNGKTYIECIPAETPIQHEQDALELVAACVEHSTGLLLLQAEALSPDFFKLRTGLAGSMLQKFVNYHIKTAMVVTDGSESKGKFKEMAMEANKGNHFRVFSSTADAEGWLLN